MRSVTVPVIILCAALFIPHASNTSASGGQSVSAKICGSMTTIGCVSTAPPPGEICSFEVPHWSETGPGVHEYEAYPGTARNYQCSDYNPGTQCANSGQREWWSKTCP